MRQKLIEVQGHPCKRERTHTTRKENEIHVDGEGRQK